MKILLLCFSCHILLAHMPPEKEKDTTADAPSASSLRDDFASAGIRYRKGKAPALSEVSKDSDEKMVCYDYNDATSEVTKVYALAHFFGEVPRDTAKEKHGFAINLFPSKEARDKANVQEVRKKKNTDFLPFVRKASPIQNGALTYKTGFGAGSVGWTEMTYSIKKENNKKVIMYQISSSGPFGRNYTSTVAMYCEAEG